MRWGPAGSPPAPAAHWGKAARDALAKVEAALPAPLRPVLEENGLLVAPLPGPVVDDGFLTLARTAIREERKLAIVYRDADGTVTSRTVWPLALGFLEKVLILAARCELRGDYRHFRADRVLSWELGERYPESRSGLLRAWSAARGYNLEPLGDLLTEADTRAPYLLEMAACPPLSKEPS